MFVPEEWQRTDRQQQTVLNLLATLCMLLLSFFLVMGGIRAVISLTHHQFATRTFLLFFLILIGKSMVQIVNLLPILLAAFKTSEPYLNQLITTLSFLALQILVKSASFALLAGFIQDARFRFQATHSIWERLLIGSSLGTLIAGASAMVERFSPSLKPLWPDYSHAGAYLPGVSFALTTFTTFIASTITYYLIFKAIDYFTNGWKERIPLAIALSLPLGIAVKGTAGIEHISAWLIGGCVLGLVLLALYVCAIRFDRTLIPIAMGTFVILDTIQQGIFNPYPGALLGALLSIIIIAPFALWWSTLLCLPHKR